MRASGSEALLLRRLRDLARRPAGRGRGGASTTATRARRRRSAARRASRRSRSASVRSPRCSAGRRRCPTTTTSRSSRSTGSTARSPTTTRCRSCSTTRCTRASGSPSRRASKPRWARNADAGRYFQDEMRSRGYELLADPDHQLVELTAVKVPEGVDGKEIQGAHPARARHRGRRRTRAEGAADLAGRPDGRERDPRDRRSGARRLRRRAASLRRPWPGADDEPGAAASQRARRARHERAGDGRRRRRSAPTSCSSTSRTPSRPTTRSGPART